MREKVCCWVSEWGLHSKGLDELLIYTRERSGHTGGEQKGEGGMEKSSDVSSFTLTPCVQPSCSGVEPLASSILLHLLLLGNSCTPSKVSHAQHRLHPTYYYLLLPTARSGQSSHLSR